MPHHHKKGVGTRYCSQSTTWVCGNRHDITNNSSGFFPNFVSQVEKWSSDSSLIAIIKLGQIEASTLEKLIEILGQLSHWLDIEKIIECWG